MGLTLGLEAGGGGSGRREVGDGTTGEHGEGRRVGSNVKKLLRQELSPGNVDKKGDEKGTGAKRGTYVPKTHDRDTCET